LTAPGLVKSGFARDLLGWWSVKTKVPVSTGATSRLIERTRELAEVTAMLSNGQRLVTLTGPGGTGKTRLALQVGAELVDFFVDGVFFVRLAGLRDPSLVASAITTEARRDRFVEHQVTLRNTLRVLGST